MAKKQEELAPFQSSLLTAQENVPPLILADLLQQLGLSAPQRPAKELVDQSFVILRARQFPSKYPGQDHAYYCVAADSNGEKFTVVLGGYAVCDVLDALVKIAPSSGIQCTLRWKEGGSYEGYYVLE